MSDTNFDRIMAGLNGALGIAKGSADTSAYRVHAVQDTRIHKTLRMPPAMVAGIADRLWSTEDAVALIDARKPEPKKRGPYKKRGAA